ncbi:30S ribosomal protein S4 [bioreactor metagenome]|uniref:30S ribosomal protein S4 n=1 Tax=bioreactor metagenome TaxID=1076179 RepID=A0A645A190_9ZZZZ
MARYTGPVCRLCRREGIKLFLKSERCYTSKCALERRATIPGQHGQGRRGKVSDYGLHLREKQKTRRIYGVLENQFRRYFAVAKRKKGMSGTLLLQMLETRLDNVVFRLGLAGNRVEARQLVRHGHFNVNGRHVDIPSYLLKANDVIEVRSKSKTSPKFVGFSETLGTKALVSWLQLDVEAMRGTVLRLPTREEIDVPVAENLIIEYYSR